MTRNSRAWARWRRQSQPRFLAAKFREKGAWWAVRKLASYLFHFTSFLLLVPLAVVLRMVLLALKPLVYIRFGRLWSPRLGPFVMFTELYLCERDAGMQPPRALDLWYHYDQDAYVLQKPVTPRQAICNQQVSKMWERVIHVTEVARPLDRLNRMLGPGSATFTVANHYPYTHDLNGLLSRFPSHLSFTGEEVERGRAELGKMGIGPDEPFVCFHARDSAYLDAARPKNAEVYSNWSWQDLRDATILNYVPTAEMLAELGYYAIRMGKYVKDPLTCDNPRIIDYATRYQSDFMDVFLSARCAFFIGQSSGMTTLPMGFRRPMAFVNVFPLHDVEYCQYSPGIMIPKKYHSQKRGRNLTFREILELGLARTNIKSPEHQRLFDSLGLEIVENTPEEIHEAALEMHQRLNCTFSPSEEDRELQARFLAAMRSHPDGIHEGSKAPCPVASSYFLRTNRELLE